MSQGCQTSRFFRPVDWRRSLAEEISRGQGVLDRRVRDPWVSDYVDYCRHERHLRNRRFSDRAIYEKLDRRFPDLAQAAEFYNNQNTLSACSLQAHLLSEMTDQQVADRFGISVRAVELYSRIFWDVRDRLDNIEYVAGYVIGPVFQAGIENLNPVLMSRYFSYFAGSGMLQLVLYGLTRQATVRSDEELLGFLESVVEQNLRLQTAIMTGVTQPTRFDLRTLLEGYVSLKAASLNADKAQQENNWIAALMKSVQQTNQLPRGKQERDEFRDRTSLVVDGLVLEPRAAVKQGLIDNPEALREEFEKCRTFKIPER